MAKIIVKWRYYKAGDPNHSKNYVNYIATREGVERCDESWKLMPPTRDQERFIQKLLTDFASGRESFEYQDFIANPTRYTASQLISATIDENIDLIETKENYMQYIALRPRVEKQGRHGLFTQEETPIVLDRIANEVAFHDGIVWRTIISLKREDATRLGYDNADAWKKLLRSQAANLAKSMGIPLSDLRWYAAFHNEGHHPHVHLVSYSVGKKPYLSQEQLVKMKQNYADEIFKNDLMETYKRQTVDRDELRKLAKERLQEIIEQINSGTFENERVEQLLVELAQRMENHKGKAVYGFLNNKMKNLVDTIVDEIASDERIAALYELWYRSKEEIIKTYTDIMPERIPLSQNNEFKSIRNAVVKEVLNLMLERDIIQEPEFDEPNDVDPDDEDIENEETAEPKNKWDLYRQAKELLDKESENYNPQLAIKMFMDSARLGCSVAKYQLGKLFMTDEHRPKDVEYALRWLEEAADDGNHYAEYLIGKLYLKGEDIEQDAEEAESYLRRAAEHGNKYASYALAKAYLDGELFGKNIPEAIKHLTDSADKGFAQAEYLLGKLLYRGEIVEKDVGKALEYLERATSKGNSYAAYLAGTILMTEDGYKDTAKAIRYFEIAAEQGNPYAEYQLGKIYLFGKDADKDFDKAMEYLKSSAEHGNKYAEQLYQNANSNRNWSAGMGAFRLFHHLARIIQNRIDDEKKGKIGLVDRKLRRMINEKKEAQGLKLE